MGAKGVGGCRRCFFNGPADLESMSALFASCLAHDGMVLRYISVNNIIIIG